MASLSLLIPMVQSHVRNCPDVIINYWLNQSARDFCRRTRYLRDTIVVPTFANLSVYDLTASDPQTEVTGINVATYNGEPLAPRSPEEVPVYVGDPLWFWFYPRQEIYVGPTPSVDSPTALSVRVFLQPILGSLVLSDELLLRYDQTIAHGAIWRLFEMPDAGWSQPDRISIHKQLELEGQNDARYEADRQHRQYNYGSMPGF